MQSIDYGIDLGTTTSAIARWTRGALELFTGPDGSDLLPSALYVDRDGVVIVGAAALDRRAADPANGAIEFKRLMGTNEVTTFAASNRRMTPEELSAAVLAELLRWVQQSGEPALRAAVLTVPAMFQLPQCEATRRAAALAGIEHAPLLQEPIAAAMAHSGAGVVKEGYWLIYDLGGGTFDVSLVRSRGGRLQVLEHDGDNHLGGKDFDRVIVRWAAEQIRAEGRLGAFRRADPGMADAFARLKTEAERVRIALSEAGQVEFRVNELARVGDSEEWVGVSLTLDRDHLESLIEPVMQRSIALCRKLLDRSRVTRGELSGVVLVGGPTLTPCIPPRLAQEVGVTVGHFTDPRRIVARGAALFAATQKLPPGARPSASDRRAGTGDGIQLQLEYEPMTTNPRPLLVGRVWGADALSGLTVRVQHRDQASSVGPVSVNEQGSFCVPLELRRGVLNELQVSVLRPGIAAAIATADMSILHGLSVSKPPLSQSVGVMLANNAVRWYLKRGASLPTRSTNTHATTVALRRGQSGEAINIPLLQGESELADRNKVIGVLRIHAEHLTRDLPVGSEVQVTLSVDEFSQTTARAYIPLLNASFEDVVMFQMESKGVDQVSQQLQTQKERLAALEQLADELDAGAGQEGKLDHRVMEIETLLEEGDRDSVDEADQMMRTVMQKLDDTEAVTRRDSIRVEFSDRAGRARKIVEGVGDASERRQLEALVEEFVTALEQGDMLVAEAKSEELEGLSHRVLIRIPGFWASFLEALIARVNALGLASVASKAHIDAGRAAAENQNLAGLVSACQGLMGLLPDHEQGAVSAAQSRLISQIL